MDQGAGGKRAADGRSWLEQLAREAGEAMDRGMREIEATSRQLYGGLSKETQANISEFQRRASIVMEEARNEVPRLRAELREMRARVRDRIR